MRTSCGWAKHESLAQREGGGPCQPPPEGQRPLCPQEPSMPQRTRKVGQIRGGKPRTKPRPTIPHVKNKQSCILLQNSAYGVFTRPEARVWPALSTHSPPGTWLHPPASTQRRACRIHAPGNTKPGPRAHLLAKCLPAPTCRGACLSPCPLRTCLQGPGRIHQRLPPALHAAHKHGRGDGHAPLAGRAKGRACHGRVVVGLGWVPVMGLWLGWIGLLSTGGAVTMQEG